MCRGHPAERSTAGAVSRPGRLEPPEQGWQSEGYLVRPARARTQDIVGSVWPLGFYSGPNKNVWKVSCLDERFFCLGLA